MVKKRGLGGLGSEPERPDPTAGRGWGDYILRFLNPLSQPPPSTEPGPAWRDVIVPPASPGRPPGVAPQGGDNYLLDFINPFSQPPGQTPIGFRPDQAGPYPRPYANEQLERRQVYPERLVPEMPLGWQPPPTLRQRIERGLEAQGLRRSQPPPAEYGHPVLRRRKPKTRESEA